MKNRRTKVLIAVAVAAALAVPGTAVAAEKLFKPKPAEYVSFITGDTANIGNGVAFGANVAFYKSSGIGPAGNGLPSAQFTAEERLVPLDVFPDFATTHTLPAGVTITEAQTINVLKAIGANLAAAGLTYEDVVDMRVFLQNPAGEEKMDYNGFNRGYRQFFANTNLATGATIDVPLGTGPAAPPLVVNPARPSRFALEVENLPVNGWLVEIQVDAIYPEDEPAPKGKKHKRHFGFNGFGWHWSR
ncbi:Endoribonuclease L-PSP [Xylanimonas cellulosilytica DSM 15894]|uniref:Endoribonuclease L-PSP n=1 Tax=Xylanimonas cellulosilytica (strain DSM 15894 / JCM 12276 / CECT 5975 / KCTC 9989 / LMG 20990 / NBRC 107835 / XIL07) TaxID=446471 RepID=D1BTU4_XYLCX|nr:Rid family hydrolase [Xylanimonas cellulosilytica]ACZ29108.1 Endoribonuclease L-PSP [Xylanimonas cellulosilytica DSM 15894]